MMSKPDLPLLRKAVEWAKEQNDLPLTESQWYQADYYTPGDQIGRECTTAYCIAGFVVSQRLSLQEMRALGPSGVDALAYKMLGLSCIESIGLFAANNDIEDVVDAAEEIAENAGEKL